MIDEVTRELRAYRDDAPGDDLTDEQLDAMIDEAIADSIYRAACEDTLDLYARTDPEEPPW